MLHCLEHDAAIQEQVWHLYRATVTVVVTVVVSLNTAASSRCNGTISSGETLLHPPAAGFGRDNKPYVLAPLCSPCSPTADDPQQLIAGDPF